MRRNRTISLAILALALLIAAAFFARREPKELQPSRPPKSRPAGEALAREETVVPSPAKAAAPAPAPIAVAVTRPVAGPPGTVRGMVKIVGEIPLRKTVRLRADPRCEAMHAGVILSDQVVVDGSGNVQWAFVSVKSGPIGTPPPAPTTPVMMDQIRCVFTPHMVGVRVGQPLRVVSSDDLLHNVHGLPLNNREFNVGLPAAGMDVVKTFDKPEIFVIKCDVHPWMRSWVGVVEHPYFSITNELGSYAIRDLPPGKYSIEAWHELYKPVTREVELTPGGDVALDFVLDVKKD